MPSSVADDEFFEYNPHPYQGGYDIALTYGQPLPPSPSTCYPISHPSTPTPTPTPTPPSPKSPVIQVPIPASPPRSSSDYGESDHLPVSTILYDGVFGFWPLSAEESRRCGADVEVEGYWNQLKRAGDYLFGYTEGYGERIVQENSYGIPVYANMKEGCPSVSYQLEPARDYKVDYVDDNVHLFDDDTGYKSYGCAYTEHYYDQPIHVVENMNEVGLQLKLTHHEVHEDIVEHTCHKVHLFSDDTEYKSYGCAYTEHYYDQPIHVVENMNEVGLQLKLTHHEVHEDILEHTCHKWDSYYEEDKNYCVAYDNHEYEMPLYGDQNLIEPTVYHQFNYPEVYEMHVYPQLEWTPYLENTEKCYLYGNKQHDAEDNNNVELEPYKPTWSQYHYYPDTYVDDPCPEFSWSITDY